jgi:hypothetical protein
MVDGTSLHLTLGAAAVGATSAAMCFAHLWIESRPWVPAIGYARGETTAHAVLAPRELWRLEVIILWAGIGFAGVAAVLVVLSLLTHSDEIELAAAVAAGLAAGMAVLRGIAQRFLEIFTGSGPKAKRLPRPEEAEEEPVTVVDA